MSLRVVLALSLFPTLLSQFACAELVTFDDRTLAPNSEWHGPDPAGVTVPGPFGPVTEGSFTSSGVAFVNRVDQTFGNWSGFAYSNMTDSTTPGFGNQYSAFPGVAHSGTNFGVASGYDDLVPNVFDGEPFDPTNVAHLLNLPHLTLPVGTSIISAFVTNTTYGALAMLDGNAPTKKFGGASGDDPDWLKLSAYGIDGNGNPLGTVVEFYLADFRFEDNTQDYVVDTWELLDLTPLASAEIIAFNISSSDVGTFGMNVPGTFAIDSITTAVPEPGCAMLLLSGLTTAGVLQLRRRRMSCSPADGSRQRA